MASCESPTVTPGPSVNALLTTPTSMSTNFQHVGDPNDSELANQYGVPSLEPSTSFAALKGRIRHHYEEASGYYYSLWGEHIHHGYFLLDSDTKEKAQTQLIDLLLDRSQLEKGKSVLDVGCGIGGTSRFLARNYGCDVTGITISGKQVETAVKLTKDEVGAEIGRSERMKLGKGSVRFIELDAETMGEYPFDQKTFNCVWISEAMSHLPDKELFFQNAYKLLDLNGKLVIADWFKAEDLTRAQMEADIQPLEDGMLLPPLCTQTQYVQMARKAGLDVFSEPLDISDNVSRTWDISWALVQNPALWAFAFTQGRDGIAFLQAIRAMRKGYANGTFRYAVMVFQKQT